METDARAIARDILIWVVHSSSIGLQVAGRQRQGMDPRSIADGAFAFFRPDTLWRRRARELWIGAWIAAAAIVVALIVEAGPATTTLSMLDANLAFGFARIDPPIVYQEIRGRYAYCGYDWDRQCQIRDPMTSQIPAVDRWLSLYPPNLRMTLPPPQSDVVFMESQGAASLVDDPRFADAEYVLGFEDVVTHVFGAMAAGGVSTVAAVAIALALGFATFGGPRARAINPLWFLFALVAAAFFAWMAVHVLAEPAGFAIVIALEMAAAAAVPAFGLVRFRAAIARREIAHAYFSAVSSRVRAVGASATPAAGGPAGR